MAPEDGVGGGTQPPAQDLRAPRSGNLPGTPCFGLLACRLKNKLLLFQTPVCGDLLQEAQETSTEGK